MSFESSANHLESLERERNTYPERSFQYVDKAVERLKKLQNGEIKKAELTDGERAEILSFENRLGVELEEIFEIKINSASISPEFLLTEEGREAFSSQLGFEIEGDSVETIKEFIFQNRKKISEVSGKKLQAFEGKARKHAEEKLQERIVATMKESGEIDVAGIELCQPINLLLNPGEALEKIRKLRDFKKRLKDELVNQGKGEIADYRETRQGIIEQYKRRVNELIAEQFGYVVKIRSLAEKVGEENLTENEKKFLQQFTGLRDFVLVYSKFDKFINGAEYEIDEKGYYRQIGVKLENYADELEKNYIENEKSKKQKAAERGLDLEKIKEKNIPKEIFVKYAEEFLEHYGQKSSMPSEEFDPQRKGAAPDGKWQFVPRDKYRTMEVDPDRRVIKAPTRDRSVQELIASLLGHEFTHFIQALNRKKITLRLYEKVGGDRRQLLAEAGTMSMQSLVSEEIFGFKSLPQPNYVRAMARKINGGNYLDCVKVFYECSLRTYLQTTEKEVNAQYLKKRAEELLGVALRSCRRLFRSGEDLNSKDSVLSKSKDTVYAEQLIVMERLREAGLEKYALIRGLNLDSLFFLLQNDFLRDDIESLDVDFIKNVWAQFKDAFVLKNENED